MVDASFKLGKKSEAAWTELKRHLEWAEGFWVVFLFSPSVISADVLRRRVEEILAKKNTGQDTAILKTHAPSTPDELRDLLGTLLSEPVADIPSSPVWIQALQTDPSQRQDDLKPWQKAWESFLLRANERREVLRERFSNGLVLVAPEGLKTLFREAAPDLWSIRTMVIELDRPVFAPSGVRAQYLTSEQLPKQTETDPKMALKEADRLEQQRPDAHLALAQAYTRAAEGFLASNAEAQAQGAADKARLYLQTSTQQPHTNSPDRAATFMQLSTIFSRLGQLETALSNSREGVLIYQALSETAPGSFLPYYAGALSNLGAMYGKLDHIEESSKATMEAVAVYRKLAEDRPDAFLPNLAMSLNNLGGIFNAHGEREYAVDAIEEAMWILAPLFLRLPSAFSEWMTAMVRNYTKFSKEAGREVDRELLDPIQEKLAKMTRQE